MSPMTRSWPISRPHIPGWSPTSGCSKSKLNVHAYDKIPCSCYGIKLPNLEGEKRDVSQYIEKLARYLEEDCKVIIIWRMRTQSA